MHLSGLQNQSADYNQTEQFEIRVEDIAFASICNKIKLD